MCKNIVLLSDGTGNSAGKFLRTNVWRVYQALELSSCSENAGTARQIAYYDDGVGSSSFTLLAILGGAFGWGLKRNVIDLYTFLCRNYQSGDAIYGFGFSRGAFTIRVLAALIDSQGLVHADSERQLRRLATAAFHRYRREWIAKKNRLVRGYWALHRMLTEFGRSPPLTGERPEITFLGLWDTVAAYGLPFDELTRFWDVFFPLSAPNRILTKKVKRACHALALDDERQTFHPVLWNEDKEPQNERAIYNERVTQVWFAGMHSNVGGGYAEDGLAYVSLCWIMGEAKRAGLRFKPEQHKTIEEAADPFGRIYDSRRGFGGTYRYLPRRLTALTNDIDDARDQVVIQRPKIHQSVIERITSGTDGYAPIVLPPRYAVVESNSDKIVDMPEGDSQASSYIEHATQAKNRIARQQQVWHFVRLKRAAYVAAIVVAAALVIFPLVFSVTSACEGRFCALSPVISGIGMFLPNFVDAWLNAYQRHPGVFALLAGILGVLLYLGGWLQLKLFDQMRAIWVPFRKNPGLAIEKSVSTKAPSDVHHRGSQHRLYARFVKFIKRQVVPLLVGALTLLLVFGFLSKGVFEMLSSAGWICNPAKSPGERLTNGTFPSKALCWASNVTVTKGQRYRITLMTKAGRVWKDGDFQSAEIGGFGVHEMPLVMYLGLPFRRNLAEPWFKPIAKIGYQGNDEYPLDPVDWSVLKHTADELIAEITARRSGQLFLFLNDAVLPVPKAWQWFYRNNEGEAKVTVQPIVSGE